VRSHIVCLSYIRPRDDHLRAFPGWSRSVKALRPEFLVQVGNKKRKAIPKACAGAKRNASKIPVILESGCPVSRDTDRLLEFTFAKTCRCGAFNQAVYGELRAPDAARTIVFYAHYDGQPVDTTRWSNAPWQPVLRDGVLEDGARTVPWNRVGGGVDPEWRIYGRSASDDKSPIVAILRAVDALRASDVPLSVNLKFFFGGTALLIVVGVAMDTVQQIESQLIMRHYEGFLKGTRIRGRRG